MSAEELDSHGGRRPFRPSAPPAEVVALDDASFSDPDGDPAARPLHRRARAAYGRVPPARRVLLALIVGVLLGGLVAGALVDAHLRRSDAAERHGTVTLFVTVSPDGGRSLVTQGAARSSTAVDLVNTGPEPVTVLAVRAAGSGVSTAPLPGTVELSPGVPARVDIETVARCDAFRPELDVALYATVRTGDGRQREVSLRRADTGERPLVRTQVCSQISYRPVRVDYRGIERRGDALRLSFEVRQADPDAPPFALQAVSLPWAESTELVPALPRVGTGTTEVTIDATVDGCPLDGLGEVGGSFEMSTRSLDGNLPPRVLIGLGVDYQSEILAALADICAARR